MKDTAKNQLKKTLTDLKKDELTKIDKKGGIKRVEDEATNGEDREGELKRSLFDDEVDIFEKMHYKQSFILGCWSEECTSEIPAVQGD